jgi:hypothetical protein
VLTEVLDDHDEVAGRGAGFILATCDPAADVLGAIIDNGAQPPLGVNGMLYVGEALPQSAHGLPPFATRCSSSLAILSASSCTSMARAVPSTSRTRSLPSAGVMSPSATFPVIVAAALTRSAAFSIFPATARRLFGRAQTERPRDPFDFNQDCVRPGLGALPYRSPAVLTTCHVKPTPTLACRPEVKQGYRRKKSSRRH